MRKRKLIITAVALTVVLCGLLAAVTGLERLQSKQLQQEKLEEVQESYGTYNAESIVLPNTTPEQARMLADLLQARLRMTADGSYAVLYLPEGVTPEDVYADDTYQPYLASMELDYYVYAEAVDANNNPLISNRPSASVSDPLYPQQDYLDYVNLQDTWNTSTGAGVVVAVIDSGIDTDHPDFAGKISERSYDASNDKVVGTYGMSVIEDYDGHGTSVAGVIAAGMNDGVGITGIAPNVELIVIKCETDGNGQFLRTSDLVFGLAYAIECDADVVNMSFGTSTNDFARYTQLAADSDIICVASAGNDGSAMPCYPAADEHVIGVGALDTESWTLAYYSNYGFSTVLAPGTAYTTAVGGTYKTATGTSISAPVVTSAVALYLSQNPYTEFDEMCELLKASSVDLGILGEDRQHAFGALDIHALVCEEKGTITYEMLTDEVKNQTQIFVKGHTIQYMPEPERANVVLDGWYHDMECTDEVAYYETVFTEDVTLYPAWINEDDGTAYIYRNLSDGTVEIASYTGRRRYLTIPATLEGKTVSSIGEYAFSGNSRLRSVTFPDTLKNIGEGAFYDCVNIRAIEIPESVQTIGKQAFYGCVSLGQVGLMRGGDLRVIGDQAFAMCGITSIHLPKTVSELGSGVFYGSFGMTSITVEPGNASYQIKNNALYDAAGTMLIYYPAALSGSYTVASGTKVVADYAFAYSRCGSILLNEDIEMLGISAFSNTNIRSMVLPSSVSTMGEFCFEGSRVSEVTFRSGIALDQIPGGAFRWCSYLTNIVIPKDVAVINADAFSGSGLKTLSFENGSCLLRIDQWAFNGCALVSVTLPGSLQEIGWGAFQGCRMLQTVTWTANSKLSAIGEYAFEYCLALKNIAIPDSVTKVGYCAFFGSGLENLTIGKNLVEVGDGAFSGCPNLQSIQVAPENAQFKAQDGVVFSKDGTVLHFFPAGRSGSYALPANTVRVADYAFANAYELTDVALNEGLDEISGYAFSGCESLTTSVLPASLTTIGENAFEYCSAMSGYLLIPKNVISIGRFAFFNDYALTEIVIEPESKLTRISYGTFGYCGITSFTVPGTVSSMGQEVFVGCKNLLTVTFEADSRLQAIAAWTFSGAEELRQITFEEGSQLQLLEARSLEGLRRLERVTLEYCTQLKTIDNYAFQNCSALTEVSLPASLEEIGRYAFNGCSSLSRVDLPESVRFIGRYAFNRTNGMNVYFSANVLPLNLEENWDYGINGYYAATAEVITSGDWQYALTTDGKVSIVAYTGSQSHVTLSSIDGHEIISIGGYAFADNTSLQSIILPDTLQGIYQYAFKGTTALQSVTVPAAVAIVDNGAFQGSGVSGVTFAPGSSLVTLGRYAFADTPNLTSVAIPDGVKEIRDYTFQNSAVQTVTFGDASALTQIGRYAFTNSGLQSFTLPAGVTLIDDDAFRGCAALQNVDLSRAKDLQIFANAFYGSGLTSVQIPAGVQYIGEFCFTACRNLTQITVDAGNANYASDGGILYNKAKTKLITCPAGKTGSLTVPATVSTLGFAAFENSLLSEVVIPADSQLVTLGYRVFFNCDKLTSIAIPDGVQSIDNYAFAECNNLATVTFTENSQLSGIYKSAFYNNTSLASIEIPAGVQEIGEYAFYGCGALTELDFAENSQLKGIYDYAFASSGLTEFIMPEGLLEIGNYAFQNAALTKLECNDQLTSIGDYAFAGCTLSDTKVLKFPATLERMGKGTLADARTIEELTLPSIEDYTLTDIFNAMDQRLSLRKVEILGGTRIHEGAFMHWCIDEVVLPDGLTSIGMAVFFDGTFGTVNIPKTVAVLEGGAFRYAKIEALTLPEGLQRIEDGVFNSSTIRSVNLPESLVSIGTTAFANTNITSAKISKNVKQIGDGAFSGCNNLLSIDVDSDNPNYASRDGILYTKDLSALISVPGGLSGKIVIPDGIKKIPNDAFYACDKLIKVVLPETVSYLGDRAFSECHNLEYVNIPAAVSYIGDECFYQCHNLRTAEILNGSVELRGSIFFACNKLESVFLPEGLPEIPTYTFVACTSLKEIKIPESVTRIGYRAFEMCTSLTEMAIPANVQTIETAAFGGCTSLETIQVDPQNTAFSSADGILCNADGTSIICAPAGIHGHVVIPEGVRVIEEGAFENCAYLEEVTIPNSVEQIKDVAFCLSSSLAKIHIGKGVKDIGRQAFDYTAYYNDPANWQNGVLYIDDCVVGIQSENRDVFIRDGARVIACCGMNQAERVWMPDSVEYISSMAFGGMENLKYVRISKNLKGIYETAFGYSNRMHSINLPDGIGYVHPGAISAQNNLQYLKLGAVENSCVDDPYVFMLNIPTLKVVSIPYSNNATPFVYDSEAVPDKIIITTTVNMNTDFLRGIPDTTKVYCYVDASAGWPEGWNQGCTTYYKDEWHLATFYADDIIVTMEPLTLGDVVQTPAESFVIDFLPIGSQFLGWDINGDGQPDEIPVTLTEDLEAHALTYVPIREIGISETEMTMEVTDEKTLVAEILPEYHSDPGTLVWSSSDETVATVDQNGKVTALAEGQANITATLVEDSSFSASCTVTVIPLQPGIRLKETYGEFEIGQTVTLEARYVLLEDVMDTLCFTSSDETVATVDQTGKITVVGPGYAQITVSCGGYTADYWVTGLCPVESICINLESPTINVNETRYLTVNYYPENATVDRSVEWGSSNPNIASIDINGDLIALAPGTVTIWAQTPSGLRAECEITVTAHLQWITLNTTVGTLRLDRTKQLEVIYEPSSTTDDKTVVWSSSDPQIASVSDTGLVTAHKRGTAVITGQVGSLSATYTVTVIGLRDETTGITVTNSDDTPMREEVELDVSQVEQSQMESSMQSQIEQLMNMVFGGSSTWYVFDITLTEYGQAIQPDTPVDVEIPFFADMDQTNFKIYRVEQDGSLTDMTAEILNSNACFKTDHFSMYVLASQTKDAGKPGDINGDGKVNNKDASRLFQYLSGWDVEVDASRLDINGDGKVNNKDASRLFQYLSGWDVEIR